MPAPSFGFHLWGEHVAAGADRLKKYGLLGILLHLLTHATDENIDTAVVWIRRTPLREVDQLISSQDTAWPLAENKQQIKLGSRQRNTRAIGVVKLPGMPIQPPTVEGQHVAGLGGIDRQGDMTSPPVLLWG